MNLLLVMVGGFFGAISRYILSEWIPIQNDFPSGTLAVNLIGCLFMGWFLTFIGQYKQINPYFAMIIGTGFIGSFTTFSAFSVETILLFQSGFVFLALLYVFLTIFLGLISTFMGYKIGLFHIRIGKRV